jgi:hypothetical protein
VSLNNTRLPVFITETERVYCAVRNEYLHICQANLSLQSSHLQFVFNPFFAQSLNFLGRFSKKPQMSNLMTIYPVGTVLFHVEKRADGHEGNSRFWQFYESA